MSNDPRIGKDVIATNGTFAGVVSDIYQTENGERFEVTGYNVRTDARGPMRDIDPKNVVAVFTGDEALFQRHVKEQA